MQENKLYPMHFVIRGSLHKKESQLYKKQVLWKEKISIIQNIHDKMHSSIFLFFVEYLYYTYNLTMQLIELKVVPSFLKLKYLQILCCIDFIRSYPKAHCRNILTLQCTTISDGADFIQYWYWRSVKLEPEPVRSTLCSNSNRPLTNTPFMSDHPVSVIRCMSWQTVTHDIQSEVMLSIMWSSSL